MAKKKGGYSGQPSTAKLIKLHKLSLQTAKLAVEVFGDVIAGHTVPQPPKPKKSGGIAVFASSVPQPPKPKLESLELIAEGALSIGQGVEELVESGG